jgi:hypothetical protein
MSEGFEQSKAHDKVTLFSIVDATSERYIGTVTSR